MKIRILLLAIIASAMAATSAQAALVTIDFTTLDQNLVANIYNEGGFEVDASGTNDGEIAVGRLTEFFFSQGEVFTISRDNGGLFQLISFDHGSFRSISLADEFQILGFLNGAQVVDFGTFAGIALSTVSNLSSISIDQLQIVATGDTNAAPPVWDNFVLNTIEASEVPLPAAFWFMGAGIAAYGARRKKKIAA